MDSTNIRPLFSGFSLVRRFGAMIALFATFALSACNFGPAQEGDETLPPPSDGIGTSPSPPTDDDPDPPPPPPDVQTSLYRYATANDPTGCPAGMIVLQGTRGSDVLVGTGADECFVGLAGDDAIFTRGGHDVVLAGAGIDYVASDRLADVIDAEDVVRLDESL